jgi:hypothetical protein
MTPALRIATTALALALAACGGGSGTSTSTSAGADPSSGGTTAMGSAATGSTAVASVSVAPAGNTLDVGASFQASASLEDSTGAALSGRAVSWTSSNQAVASVDGSGVVTGVAAGTSTITASSEGRSASLAVTVVAAATPAATVKVDLSQAGSPFADLLGVNRLPTATSQTPGTSWDGSALYAAFGVGQIRMHDGSIDLCTVYKAATRLNLGVTPAQPVQGCTLSGTGGVPHFQWTPSSPADADLNDPDNYDFTAVDQALQTALATGASVYLRLGESYNGPNDTADPVAWAKVAANIYRHVIGQFKPTAGIAVQPVFVEVFNEPDGAFWRGDLATFNTLYTETTQRVRAAASAAGRTVVVGGAGFTHNVLAHSTESGNPARDFVANVGASTLDFYSAHLYDRCDAASWSSAAGFLRNLRALVDGQGGSGKPIHITEWNIGLGQQCGASLFSSQRTQSFVGGVLTLMQDPAHVIQAAHFYAGMPIMPLFDFTTIAGAVRVNPSAWAFWAHGQVKGAARLGVQVCPAGGSCMAGYASEATGLLALAGSSGGRTVVVVTNDSSSAATYALQLDGASAARLTAIVSTPPPGSRDLATTGNPATPDAAAVSALLASVTQDTRSELIVRDGHLTLQLMVPAKTTQTVQLRVP